MAQRNPPEPVNILFTSVGRRVELLRAFRRAYQTLNLAGQIVAVDMDPLAPALQVADRPYLVPRLSDPAYLPTLLEICRREKVSLLFPLIDPDIPLLAEHHSAFQAIGVRLAVVGPQAAQLTADKWQTYHFFSQLQLPAPRSWLPGQLNPAQADYPMFIKPRYGSAAQHTFKVRNAAELAFFSSYVPQPIIQEYLPGVEITHDVICDPDGQLLTIVSRQRLEVRWGEVAKGVTVYHPAMSAACLTIARHLPAAGPITVQCILKENQPYFTEINARLGGGLPLGIAAGADSPRWLLARAAGLPVEIPPLGQSYRPGVTMTRFDGSFFLSEAEREQMAGRCL